MALVGIIIPTWNTPEMLIPCVTSIINNSITDDLVHIYVVNNGTPESVECLTKNPLITVLQQDHNLGWEGGLKVGIAASKEKYLVFMNDDTFVPMSSRRWINQMLNHFVYSDCAAVGPTSNVVMGSQYMFANMKLAGMRVKFLIGFCMMVRRDYLEEAGGVDDTLPGGDDLDLSIRFRNIGKYLFCDREVFVYHHGFKSGVKKHGAAYNAPEMIEKTNHALIRKHGLKAFLDLWTPFSDPELNGDQTDKEGDLIKQFVVGDKVVELGCGDKKTVPHAIGIDMVVAGTPIPGLDPSRISRADIVGDVSQKLPVTEADTIVARHILEHIVPTVEVLRNWKESLKHGGRLIIAVPNQNRCDSIPMNHQHVHAFTPKSLNQQMELLGFKTIDILDPDNGVSFVGIWEKNGN